MSGTPRQYVIREGDTLLRLSLRFGVEIDDIVHYFRNKRLSDDFRGGLLPVGETLIIPPPKDSPLVVIPQQSHRFQATIPMASVTIAFEDARGPLGGARYTLHGLGAEPKKDALDAWGVLQLELPVSVDKLRIVFEERCIEHTIWVGHLAPVRQELGVEQRLAHLGYGASGAAVPGAPAAPWLPLAPVAPVQPADSVSQRPGDPGTFRDLGGQQGAIAAFQHSIGLEPTGYADEETRDKLVARHGT